MTGLLLPILLACCLAIYATPLNPGLPILLIGVLGLYTSYLRWKHPASRREPDLLFLLAGWSLLSTLWSIDPYLSQRRSATFLGMLIIVSFLCSRVPLSEHKVWRGHLFALLAFLVGTSGLAWLLSISEWFAKDRFPPLTATFPNQDSFSFLPMLGLFLSLALIRKKEKTSLWLAAILLGLFLPSLLVTGCRSALLGLGVGLVFGFLALGKQRERALRRIAPLLAPLLLGILLIAPLLFLYAPLTQKFSSLLKPSALAKERIRWDITTQGWQAFTERPLLGQGAGAFGLAYQAYRPKEVTDHYASLLFIQNAHNDPLDLLVELGFPGLFFWTLFLGSGLLLSIRQMRHSKRPLLALATGSAVAASLAFSLFNFVLVERLAAWTLAWTLGLLFCLPSSRKEILSSERQKKLGAILLLFGSLWLLWFGAQSILAEKALAHGRSAEAKLRLLEAEEAYREAVRRQPQRVRSRLALARVLQTQAYYTGSRPTLEESKEELLRAHHNSPKNLEVLLKLGEFEIRQQDTEQADRWLRLAQDLAPYSGDVAVLEIRLSTLSGDSLGALQSLLEGPPDRVQQYLHWASKLLWEQEARETSTGLRLLQQYRLPPNLTLALLENLQQFAPHNARLRQQILEARLQLAPQDLCLRVEASESLSRTERERALQELLHSQLFHETEERCRALLLEQWAPLAVENRDWSEVAETLQPLLKQTPRSLSLRLLTAESLEQSTESRAAIEVLREGLSLEPYSAPLLFALAQTFERVGSLDLARAYYSDTLQVDPDHRGAQNGLERLR